MKNPNISSIVSRIGGIVNTDHGLPGVLIVVEGLHGTGKSSIIKTIYQRLSKQGYEVVKTAVPTPLLKNSRFFRVLARNESPCNMDFEALQLLLTADRLQHNSNVIAPCLRRGDIVLCDRYFHSTLVSMIVQNSTPFSWYYSVITRMISPDLTVVLDCDGNTCFNRVKSRQKKRIPYYLYKTFDQARHIYKEFSRLHRTRIIDTSNLQKREVADLAMEMVTEVVER